MQGYGKKMSIHERVQTGNYVKTALSLKASTGAIKLIRT
jgi:hypothetical protein